MPGEVGLQEGALSPEACTQGGRGRLYIRESDGADGKVLAAGVGVTALWVLGIYAARAAIERRKRD